MYVLMYDTYFSCNLVGSVLISNGCLKTLLYFLFNLKSAALTRGTYLGFSSGKDPGVSAQIFCTDTILSVGINILDFWYFLIDFESTTLTLSTFWDFSPRNDPGVSVTILCGAQMPRIDPKRNSSSLKACPLTKELMNEARREEEEEGMEMAGEFAACEREMLFLQ